MAFLTIISLFLLACSALLLWQVIEQRKLIREMLESEDIFDAQQEPELVITLQVKDPIALAKRESRTGRILADRLPVMTQKMVYQEVMKELERELAEREIDVDMHLEYR